MSMPHICTIKHETSKTFLPFSEDDDNMIHKLRRKLQNATMVWKNHPETRQYYRSETSYLAERRREFEDKCPLVIHPLSFFWFCTQIILTLSYITAFINFPMFDIVPAPQNPRGIDRTLILLELILIFEVIVRFFVGILNEKEGHVNLKLGFIVRSYLFSFCFIADVFGAVPLSVLYYMGIRFPYPYPLIRCIKFWRLNTLFDYCDNFWKKLNIQAFSTVYRILLLIIFYFHWSTFIIFILTNTEDSMNGEEKPFDIHKVKNMDFSDYIRTSWRAAGIILSAHSFITFSSHLREKVTSLFFLLLGKISALVVAVIFINQILRVSELKTKYEAILNQLHEFMAQRKLPMTTRERILAFYEYKFQKKYVRERNINSILSDRLNREINFHTTNQLLNKVTLFDDIPVDVVAEVLSYLKMEMYLPNDIIVRAGSPTESMYFIANGTVAVTTASGREVSHLCDGAFFGEACLILNIKKSISNIIALEICETYRLQGKMFRRCFKKYPEILSKLKKEAEERERKTQELENDFQEKLFQKTFVRSPQNNQNR